eukprot:CAMPEP_0175861610 /NCGR_PEP_ID=MMETSP0107_2-20121207/31478_1 /TAXON_ID=195067 ORGANISM="Goniomonas pacifica, Strain CCMP1869" /NCGR_SAMPLE_ID=MMETSP0107_2 /ASSEMBLY_ACC=CAM_ASM_000203 /LENGTH=72 /DNA_ID=CAMNT_0017178503 /DNA_START=12 /DNA_END=230 /DNA_ORIENTATION=-
MKESGEDEADIKKQGEVLAESEMMVPDTKQRLEKALDDLREIIEKLSGDESVSGSEDFAAAKAIVEEVQAAA